MKKLIIEWGENPLVGIVKIVKQEEQNEENIIISTLKELGINIVELLAREQLYRQWILPWEVSDIIERNLVENVRFVNVLKRNIFTEKKLPKELRKEIEKLISYYKIYNLFEKYHGKPETWIGKIIKPFDIDWEIFEKLELPTIPEDLRIRKKKFGNSAELKIFEDRVGVRYEDRSLECPLNWFEEKKTKKPLIDKITLELEAKERKAKIKRLEKEQLKPERAELERLSKSLTEREKSVNFKLTEREEKIKQKENELEKEKVAIEAKILTITAEVEKEKEEAIRNLEREKQEKINELNAEIAELEKNKEEIKNQLTAEKTETIQKLEAEKGVIISQLEREKKNLEDKEITASGKISTLENRIKELDKEIQQRKAEGEILRREINKELPWIKEGGTLREATHNFIKEKCRNEKYVPTTGDKCVSVVTAPFKWVANKTSTGFALVGFGVSIPAICGAIGWGLKAFLAVKTGGVGGAVMVADSLISQSQKKKLGENNNQGGNLPPNYQPLPQGNNNVNNQLLPAGENDQNKPITVHNHYHNLPAGNNENNRRKRKKKNKEWN